MIPGKHVQLWVDHCTQMLSKWATHYEKNGVPDCFYNSLRYEYYLNTYFRDSNNHWMREFRRVHYYNKMPQNLVELIEDTWESREEDYIAYREMTKDVFIYAPWLIPKKLSVDIETLKEFAKNSEYGKKSFKSLLEIQIKRFNDPFGMKKSKDKLQKVNKEYIEAGDVFKMFMTMSSGIVFNLVKFNSRNQDAPDEKNELVAEIMGFTQKHIYPLMDLVLDKKRKEELLEKYRYVFRSYPIPSN